MLRAGGKSQLNPGAVPDREAFDFWSEAIHFKKDQTNMISNVRLSQMLSRGWQIENQYLGPQKQKILIYLFHQGSGVSARLEPDGTLIFIHEQGNDIAAPHENIWFRWILAQFSKVPIGIKLQMARDAITAKSPAILLLCLNFVLVLLLSLK